MPASSIITLTRVTAATPDGHRLFSDLNLSLLAERCGLVGRNGVGKTTLLRLIAGQLAPPSGTVHVTGRIGLLRQDQELGERETIASLFAVTEQLAALVAAESGQLAPEDWGDLDWTLPSRLGAALARFGLPVTPETPLATLSGGQRTRAALAALLFAEPDILLLDEPTNHLDREGRGAVLDLLATWHKAALVVSHDRELLEHMDAIVELTSLGAQRYGGNYTAYAEQKAVERAALAHDLAHAEKTLDQMEKRAQLAREKQDRRDAGGRRKAARGDIPKILLGGRRENAENSAAAGSRLADRQIAEAAEARETARARVEIVTPLTIALPPTHLPRGRLVLEVADLALGYAADPPLFSGLSFRMTGPERLALVGPNGSGKSTLLGAIAGRLAPLGGSIRAGARIALLDQRLADHHPEETVLAYLRRLNPDLDDRTSRARLAQFMFRADAALQPIATLSGGQRMRAGLAALCGGTQPPELLLLDEPTNHLDLEALAELEMALQSYNGALIAVSHDQRFLAALSPSRVLTLPSGEMRITPA